MLLVIKKLEPRAAVKLAVEKGIRDIGGYTPCSDGDVMIRCADTEHNRTRACAWLCDEAYGVAAPYKPGALLWCSDRSSQPSFSKLLFGEDLQ